MVRWTYIIKPPEPLIHPMTGFQPITAPLATCFRFLIASLCVTQLLVNTSTALAIDSPDTTPSITEIENSVNPDFLANAGEADMSALEEAEAPNMYHYRSRWFKGLGRIFHYEDSLLGDRTPVILIPGRAQEKQWSSWWKKFRSDIRWDKEFNNRYKLYVFVYDSSDELSEQTEAFKHSFKKHFSWLPDDKKVIFVTYSLGGMIAREAMSEEEIMTKVDTMFGIAVPFHGSPIFDPEWFARYMKPPNPSPIRKMWDKVLYKAYFFKKDNLTRGLQWDNFDGSMPLFDWDEPKILGDMIHHPVTSYIPYDYDDALRSKTIVYASYLENEYTKPRESFEFKKIPQYVINGSAKLPKQVAGTILPVYGYSVHSVLGYMNKQLSNIPTATPRYPEGKNIHLYRYNDGALPMSSMLFLPKRDEPYEEDLNELVDIAKTQSFKNIRIFKGIDHTHIGEYSLRDSKTISSDELHPEEGEREPIEWLIYDLLTEPDVTPLKQ